MKKTYTARIEINVNKKIKNKKEINHIISKILGFCKLDVGAYMSDKDVDVVIKNIKEVK